MKTLIVDNYDSYTYNLFQLISEVNGDEAVVVRNDAATWKELSERRFDKCRYLPWPRDARATENFGICADALATPDLPILGVCLGHQGLAHANGGVVARAPDAVHGRISPLFHDESPLFAGIPQGFRAVRYHSLMVDVVPEVVPARSPSNTRCSSPPSATQASGTCIPRSSSTGGTRRPSSRPLQRSRRVRFGALVWGDDHRGAQRRAV